MITYIPKVQGSLWRAFPRLRLELNIYKPVLLGVWIPQNGYKIWIHLCYKRPQDLCFGCGTMGQEIRNCSQPRITTTNVDKFRRYGAWFCVPTIKHNMDLLFDDRNDMSRFTSFAGKGIVKDNRVQPLGKTISQRLIQSTSLQLGKVNL